MKILFTFLKRERTKYHAAGEKGIALVLTLAVLSMVLVLLLAFCTLNKMESQSVATYRDTIASRYAAQGALHRAMAEIAFRYSADSNTFNQGIGTIYSLITTNPTLNANQTNYITDIERIVTNSYGTIYPVSVLGGDGRIDTVILPTQLTNENANTAQWIAVRDTNGVLVSRIAYIVTSGGLNINTIGNQVVNQAGGPDFNSRNTGYSAGELNLPAALVAVDSNAWTFANAVSDANELLNYRYSGNSATTGYPGDVGQPDMPSYLTDLLDNNGDGIIDNAADRGNSTGGIPQLFLTNSDGTVRTTISPSGDDLIIQDLKELYDPVKFSGGMCSRMSGNLKSIQRYFSTQSSIPVPSTLANINDTTTYATAADVFNVMTNKMALVQSVSTNTARERFQLAANVATYCSTNATVPYVTIEGSGATATNVVGVARVPYINQINVSFAMRIRVTGMPAATNIIWDMNTAGTSGLYAQGEFWYPYTNQLASATTVLNVKVKNSRNDNSTIYAGYIANPSTGSNSVSLVMSTAGISFGSGITNQVWTTASTPALLNGGTSFGVGFTSNIAMFASSIVISNIGLETTSTIAGVTNDYAPMLMFPTATVAFTPQMITNAAMAYVNAGNVATGTFAVTNILSFALNDPRTKKWQIEYSGTNASLTSMGAMNKATDASGAALFRPDLGEDSGYQYTAGSGLPRGIAPKTFWVKGKRTLNSIAEFGRIHRGQAWKTIDFTGGGMDGNLLDQFTTVNNVIGGVPTTTYAHGKINLNSRPDDYPVWAALFAGMPLQTQVAVDAGTLPFLDYTGTTLNSNLDQSKALGQMIGSRSGSFTHLGALTGVMDLSNISSNYASVFPAATYAMKTDDDKELLLSQMINLVGTQGQGNTFTIWAWGQALSGPQARNSTAAEIARVNSNRFVSAETLIVGMVRPVISVSGGTNVNLSLMYFRYNPDLELH